MLKLGNMHSEDEVSLHCSAVLYGFPFCMHFNFPPASVFMICILCFSDDIAEWERELQTELQEYEVVDDGTNLDDADLENEILQQIEAETK